MKILETIRNYDLLRPGDRVLCALSGGADSVCMTYALWEMAEEWQLTLAAAHFSHGLRPEAAQHERDCCLRLCERLSIPLFCGEGDTDAYARERRLGKEEAARELRYAFLHQTADRWRADRIATGHQLEDQAETVLLHLIRGAGYAGLEGIPPRRGRLIRPLLDTSRQEIEAYARENRLCYITDPTNLGGENARSRLRNTVFPVLEELYPGAAAHLAQTAAAVRQRESENRALAQSLVAQAQRGQEGLLIPFAALRAVPQEAAARALQQWQRELGGRMLSRGQIEAILSLPEKNIPSASLDLPGTKACRRYDSLLLRRAGAAETVPPPVFMEREGEAEFGAWHITVKRDEGELEGFSLPDDGELFPILIRARQAGDTISLPAGHKTVKKLMIDRKIPKDLRDTTPILCHNKKVLAVGDLCAAAFPQTQNPRIRIICRRKKI